MVTTNDWTPTQAESLPWGEVVEVRFTDGLGSVFKCEPDECNHYPVWTNHAVTISIEGTEWRRLEVQCDGNE